MEHNNIPKQEILAKKDTFVQYKDLKPVDVTQGVRIGVFVAVGRIHFRAHST